MTCETNKQTNKKEINISRKIRAGIIRGKQVMNPHPVPRSVVRRPIFNEHQTIKSGDMFSSTSFIFVTTKIDYDKKILKKN